MKKIFTIIVLAALSLAAMAQKKSVAVLTPICRDNSVNNFYQQIVRGAMESAVTLTDEFISFDRSAFDKVLEEHKFEQSGAVDDAQIRRMGVYAGVDFVLITEVSAYDGYMSVLVKILNIETGESSKGLSELMEQTPPIVQESCKELARKLFGIVDVASGVRKGTLQLQEGRYEGEIKNGKPHGKGKIYYNSDNEYDRVSYDGEWENGVISGQGTMIWKGGNKYVGGWFEDRKSGLGTIYAADGATRIEGKYVKGELVENVTIYASNGEKYVGPMPSGNDIVQGIIYYSDGRKYVGGVDARFAKQGKGTLYKPNCKIVGRWVEGKLSGFAKIYYNDGSVESGQYVDGKKNGEWSKWASSKKQLKGYWLHGNLVTKYQ